MLKILVVGGLVVVVLLGWYFWGNQAPAPEQSADGQGETVQREGTIADLRNSSEPQQCSFNQSDGGESSAGIVYIADGNVRGDFSANVNGEQIISHVIVQGENSYVWSKDNQGVKMSFANLTADESQASSGEVNQNATYSCQSWDPDQSVFVPPSDVEFVDIGAGIQSGTGGTNSSAACAACNQLAEPDSSACREQFSC